ncbi:MAG: YidC/Oxa1 family membrane protein insertase [Anaerolineaceae bacterium]|nr:YidC/Oxa1 family membrane protein insertase [Anaerolineaceae bacterium]
MWNTLIVNPFTNILLAITMLVKNFGLAIILFTILIKLLTWPLNAQQIKSSKAMQDLQNDPKYKKIMEKYKDNKEMQAQEQMRIYKEKGISPFGSCLPMLLQMPIIIGLYQSVMKAMASSPLELMQLKNIIYPFLNPDKILPIQHHFLWMDLGQPERLMVFGFGIPVLAILVVISQFFMTKVMTPPAAGGDENNQAAMMSKSMNIYMPLLMGYIAYSWSAGLGLYLLISNILGVIQYGLMNKTSMASLMPWNKPQAAAQKPRIIETTATEAPEDDEEDLPALKEEATPKAGKPSARAMTKRQRPSKKH